MKKSKLLKRTIRRTSLPLNTGKWNDLVTMVSQYAQEKDGHLQTFADDLLFAGCGSDRTCRDTLVGMRYTSPHGLQARMWKMALKDAYETMDKNWASMSVDLRSRVAGRFHWTKEQRHYGNWLLCSTAYTAQLAGGSAPINSKIELTLPERKQVQNYLRRQIRRHRGADARVKKVGSAAFDANMYKIYVHKGRQYIELMSLIPGKRIAIPLTGHTQIKGNIRVVLDFGNRRIEVHYTVDVKKRAPLTKEPCGLDAGVTEVFTDEDGIRYGCDFGKLIGSTSEQIMDKGRKRNKLHQIALKGGRAKARRIRSFNLGRWKQKRYRRERRIEMERRINQSINEVLEYRQPSVIITEKLDIRGKAKSRKISRQVSYWARNVLNERVDFKASAGGSRREQVNPAYSSQICPPPCGYLHRENRKGDRFQCLWCGHVGSADRIGAINLKARHGDPQITLFTPKEEVRAILLARFIASLEHPGGKHSEGVTVSGRTPAQCNIERRAKRPAQSHQL